MIPEPDARAAPWWHLPAVSEPPQDASLPGGRLADAALFAFAVMLGGITQGYLWHSHGEVLDAVDVAAGAVACLALWWRRAHPMAVVVVAFVTNTFSPLALGAGLVAVGTAASRVRGRALIAVVVMAVAASVVFPLIQEGLTNARKHAPGAAVQVRITADGQAVTAEVISRRPPVAATGAAAPAGAGAGLIGLAERVALAGGQLEHGSNAIGDFVLRATIPRQP